MHAFRGVRDYCRGRCPSIATPLLDTAAAEVVQEHDDFAKLADFVHGAAVETTERYREVFGSKMRRSVCVL